MKVSGAKVAEHRALLVATARRLLQEQGFDGAGVAEISREAGLTQGALYSQFKSKDALAAEAVRKAFADGVAVWETLRETAPNALQAFMDTYLSDAHTRDLGGGCLIAACISDVRRQDRRICEVFTDGFASLVEMVQKALPDTVPAAAARSRALALVSALIGSVAMARAVEEADPHLSKEIIAAAHTELAHLATMP